MILLQIDRVGIAGIKFESDPPRPIRGHRVAHWIRACERVCVESCADNFPNMHGTIQHGQTVQAAPAQIHRNFCSTSRLEQFLQSFVAERSDQKTYVTRDATFVKRRATSVNLWLRVKADSPVQAQG
jgi:hypothetical protein